MVASDEEGTFLVGGRAADLRNVPVFERNRTRFAMKVLGANSKPSLHTDVEIADGKLVLDLEQDEQMDTNETQLVVMAKWKGKEGRKAGNKVLITEDVWKPLKEKARIKHQVSEEIEMDYSGLERRGWVRFLVILTKTEAAKLWTEVQGRTDVVMTNWNRMNRIRDQTGKWMRAVKTREGKDETDWMVEKVRRCSAEMGWSVEGGILITGSSAIQVWVPLNEKDTTTFALQLRRGLPEVKMHLKTTWDQYVLEPEGPAKFVRPEGVSVPEGEENRTIWILSTVRKEWDPLEVEKITAGWPLERRTQTGTRIEVLMASEEQAGNLVAARWKRGTISLWTEHPFATEQFLTYWRGEADELKQMKMLRGFRNVGARQ